MSDTSGPAEPGPMDFYINPAAAANVAVVLFSHLCAFMLRHGRMTQAEVAEIFRTAQSAYNRQVGTPPLENWGVQTFAILQMAQGDAYYWAEQQP